MVLHVIWMRWRRCSSCLESEMLQRGPRRAFRFPSQRAVALHSILTVMHRFVPEFVEDSLSLHAGRAGGVGDDSSELAHAVHGSHDA